MSGMLTLTEIPGNKFRKFARTSDFDTLHNTNNTNNLPDTIVKAEQFNRNSIRVIRKTIAVNAVIDCYVDETDKEFSDIKCNADHKKTRTDDKIIYKGDSSGIFGVKSKGYRQKHELDNDQSSGFEENVPNKNDEISREHKDELNMHCKLDLNRCNQAKDSRSFISERTSDKLGMKVCGYRPGTTIDNFRRDFQIDNSEKENVVEGLDIEEGNRIWNDVNKIINRRDYKARRNTCLSERFGGSNASLVSSETECHSKSAEYSRSSKNSIEFSPRFSSRNHKRSWRHVNRIWSYEGLQSDRNCTLINNGTGPSKLGGFKNRKISDVFPDGVEKTRLPVRWTGLINNIWSTVDNMIGFKQDQSKKTNNSRRWRWSVMGECKDKSVAMTTMLPRITPSSTPLPTGITQPPPRSHSSASMYVPYPPKELSSSIDFVRIPGRINPLAPPPPRRRINWSWETTDQHYENEKRSLLMQKREHTRYHSAWSKAFYGAPAEKEAYRRHYREVLKQQMSDKNAMAKEEFKHKLKETEQAISYDNNCRKNDAQEYHRKHSYLMQYRDTNKQQMEDRWAQTRQSRDVENRVDRERLRYNPINWSCSLK